MENLMKDQYLDQIYLYLKQKIKQTFIDLDEIAQKNNYESKMPKISDTYNESWKEHSLKGLRDRSGLQPVKKRSLYEKISGVR